jgi:hypothetical protein
VKKLAIVGSGPLTRGNAPFDDPSFDIWVFNEAGNSAWCRRWTAVFQMHEPEIYSGHNTKDANHWQWLQRRHDKPIYMQEIDPRVPSSVRYPIEDAIRLCGVKMFPTTFAYMAALAILDGYQEVRVFGIELSATEYEYQAKGYAFWLGFLMGHLGPGNVDSEILHVENNLFDVPLYGYEGNYAFGVEYFAERIQLLDAEWNAANKHAKNVRKAIERALSGKDYDTVKRLIGTDYQEAIMKCGEAAGALTEAERYEKFGERYADRGGFEFSAASAQRNGEVKRAAMYSALGQVEYVWNVWRQTNNENAAGQLSVLIDAFGRLSEEVGVLLGVYQENIRYIRLYDDKARAGGKVLMEAAR